jgi:hypothetical protein
VLVIIIILAALGTFGYNFTTVLPLIATYILHTDAQGFGALSSFLGIGSLLAALSTAYVKEVSMRRLLVGATAFSILLALTAITPVFAISAVLLAALGAAAIVFSTSANTLLQLTVPEHLGVPAAILTCATLCMLGVITGIFYRRRHPQSLQTFDHAAHHV